MNARIKPKPREPKVSTVSRPKEKLKLSRERVQDLAARHLQGEPITTKTVKDVLGDKLTHDQVSKLLRLIREAEEQKKAELAARQARIDKIRKQKAAVEKRRLEEESKFPKKKIGKDYKLDQAVDEILDQFESMALTPRERRIYRDADINGKVEFIFNKVVAIGYIKQYLELLSSRDLAESVIRSRIRKHLNA